MQPSHVGLIIPSSNTIVEADFARAMPQGVVVHTARMFLAEVTEAAERVMITEYLPRAVEDIASLHPHVTVFACTSAGAVLGEDGERRLIADISCTTRAAVVSTNDAVNRAIVDVGGRRVAVVTPYVDELTNRIRAGIEGRGATVPVAAGMGITENLAIAHVTPAEIVEFAVDRLAGAVFDLLFVSCTNFRAIEALPALRERFAVPMVTSNQATIAAVLHSLDKTSSPNPGPTDRPG